jgi:transcriptional regulator with XRE-family HTH domain
MENTAETRVARNVATNVRRLRTKRKMSLARLSKALAERGYSKLSLKLLSKLENGERGISVDDLSALADALNVEVDDLMQPPEYHEIYRALTRWEMAFFDQAEREVQLEMAEASLREAESKLAAALDDARSVIARMGVDDAEDFIRQRLHRMFGDEGRSESARCLQMLTGGL